MDPDEIEVLREENAAMRAEMEAMAEKLEECRDVLRAMTEREEIDFYASDYIKLCRILDLIASVEPQDP